MDREIDFYGITNGSGYSITYSYPDGHTDIIFYDWNGKELNASR